MHEGAEPARCRSGVKYLFLFVRMFSYSGACGSLLPGETDLYTFLSSFFCSSDLKAQPLLAPAFVSKSE